LESPEALAVITAQPDVQQIIARWSSLKIALVGIGNTDFHSEVRVLFVDYVRPEAQERLRMAGAVGDICVRFFDQNGHPCPPAVSAILGIDLPQLRSIDTVIAVAGGANKVEAIRGALRGKYVSVLITDSTAAQGILQDTAR
jgi:DNA-binding transcriptional regulator LsrR (DeoR family)